MIDLKNSQNGFTLIELSIVILIVGVVLGGVFAGKSIIHSAKLRTVITEFRTFKAASDLFKEKYKALSGDYKKAYEHWPSGLSALGGGSVGGPYVNGNGNGVIEHTINGQDKFTESIMFWGHLSASGFIPYRSWRKVNSYGIVFGRLLIDSPNHGVSFVKNSYAGSPPIPIGIRINSPKSEAIKNAGFFVISRAKALIPLTESNAITLVSSDTKLIDDIPNGGALSPNDAQIIDQKMDDGFAASGIIHGRGGTGLAGCTLSSGGEEKYKLSTTTKDCTLYYWFDG